MQKICPNCKELKDGGDFHKSSIRKDGLSHLCKICNNRKKAAPDKLLIRRIAWLKKNYKLTLEEFQEKLKSQGSKCAICMRQEPGYRGWHIDHDHSCCNGISSCGKCIRGLLCNRCNATLGMFNDNPWILKSRIRYLAKYKASDIRHKFYLKENTDMFLKWLSGYKGDEPPKGDWD